jgi:hypothetical protein
MQSWHVFSVKTLLKKNVEGGKLFFLLFQSYAPKLTNSTDRNTFFFFTCSIKLYNNYVYTICLFEWNMKSFYAFKILYNSSWREFIDLQNDIKINA